MSRVGKKPITVPSGVEVAVVGRALTVKGSKGTLALNIHPDVTVKVENNEVNFIPAAEERRFSAIWGTMRSLVDNMIEGVTKGYSITLNLVGVGYRANTAGNKLNMTLGYSHPIDMEVPKGLTIEVKDQTQIIISGADKQLVGQFAANVRSKRPPEPFKGKGVKYANEYIAMKEGKKK
jgi:large subunit ribosomal protein L6